MTKKQLNVFATGFLNISKYGWLLFPYFYGQQNLAKNKEKLFGFTIRFYHHVLERIPRKKIGNLWCGWLSKSNSSSGSNT